MDYLQFFLTLVVLFLLTGLLCLLLSFLWSFNPLLTLMLFLVGLLALGLGGFVAINNL